MAFNSFYFFQRFKDNTEKHMETVDLYLSRDLSLS